MDRRRFLKMIGSGLPILALTPTDIFALQGSSLEDACRESARKRGISWTTRVDDRVRAEIAEIGMAGAERDLLGLSRTVRRLKEDGIRFAPAWGRTGSSVVCALLAMTELDPLLYNIGFDAVVPTTAGCRTRLSFAIDAPHIGRFLELLGDPDPEPWTIAGGYPLGYNAKCGRIEVVLVPLASPPRRRPKGGGDFRPFALEKALRQYRARFPRRSDECDENYTTRLATALAHFRPGPVTAGITLDFAVFGQKEGIDHQTYRNLIFREDLIWLVTRETGAPRLAAASYVAAAARREEEVLSPMRAGLERTARKHGRWTKKTTLFLRDLEWRCGFQFSKAHALASAIMLVGRDRLMRESATALSTIGNGDHDFWAEIIEREIGDEDSQSRRGVDDQRVLFHRLRKETLEDQDYRDLLLTTGDLNELMAASSRQ